MLSSAVLGPASSNEEDPDIESPLPHLKVPVDLKKSSGSEGYNPYLALVDSGATYDFISQAVADCLSLEAARKRELQPIVTVNGEPLCATAIVRQMVRMRDSAGAKRNHSINFVAADISYYDIILGMARPRKQMSGSYLTATVAYSGHSMSSRYSHRGIYARRP
jgi:hypothetical protein